MHACFRRSLRILPILFVGFVALSPSARCELMDSATAEQMRPIEPSPTDAAKPARKAANKRLSKTARELGGADERDAAGMPRLTEAEAKEALDQELSLKVGKQMRSDDYPDEARRQRWTGTALVEVLIAADGLIKRVELARTSGFPILDERALDVVRRVPKLFVPIRLRGGEQRAQVPIGFYLQD